MCSELARLAAAFLLAPPAARKSDDGCEPGKACRERGEGDDQIEPEAGADDDKT